MQENKKIYTAEELKKVVKEISFIQPWQGGADRFYSFLRKNILTILNVKIFIVLSILSIGEKNAVYFYFGIVGLLYGYITDRFMRHYATDLQLNDLTITDLAINGGQYGNRNRSLLFIFSAFAVGILMISLSFYTDKLYQAAFMSIALNTVISATAFFSFYANRYYTSLNEENGTGLILGRSLHGMTSNYHNSAKFFNYLSNGIVIFTGLVNFIVIIFFLMSLFISRNHQFTYICFFFYSIIYTYLFKTGYLHHRIFAVQEIFNQTIKDKKL